MYLLGDTTNYLWLLTITIEWGNSILTHLKGLYPLIFNQKKCHIHVPYQQNPFNLMRQRCAIKTGGFHHISCQHDFHDFFGPCSHGVPSVKMSQFKLEKTKVGWSSVLRASDLDPSRVEKKKTQNKSSNFQGSEKSPASIGWALP